MVRTRQALARALDDIGGPWGLNVVVAHSKYVSRGDAQDMSDYHAFRDAGRPFLFLSAGHWPHYHQVTDTPDRLDYGKVAAVSDYVVRIVNHLDSEPLGERSIVDTLPLELRTIRRFLGPLQFLPTPRLRTREDLDRVVEQLRERLGI